ncbi:MAG: hypothetical protein LAO20_09430 [Acidobacteriia bacterium]|nr:hypothetical protein [Terriglobia bacterium]
MRPTILAALFIALAAPTRRYESPRVKPDCSPYPRDATPHCVASIRGGDLAKPSFSPTGRYLAFATVTVRPPAAAATDEFSELDGTLVADLQTKGVQVLVSPEQARKYASYSAFVGGIKWRSDQLLVVTYADGDVDWDDLTIRRTDAKLLATKHGSADDEPLREPIKPPDPDLTPAQARKLLPHLPAELPVESGRLSKDQNLLAVVAGKEPHRQLLIFRLHPQRKP